MCCLLQILVYNKHKRMLRECNSGVFLEHQAIASRVDSDLQHFLKEALRQNSNLKRNNPTRKSRQTQTPRALSPKTAQLWRRSGGPTRTLEMELHDARKILHAKERSSSRDFDYSKDFVGTVGPSAPLFSDSLLSPVTPVPGGNCRQ